MVEQRVTVAQDTMAVLVPEPVTDINRHFMGHKEYLVGIETTAAAIDTQATGISEVDMGIPAGTISTMDTGNTLVADIMAVVDTSVAVIKAAIEAGIVKNMLSLLITIRNGLLEKGKITLKNRWF